MMQVVIDSLVRAAELSLLAVGLTMVYSVLRFPNFAHVELATIGAYLAFLFSVVLGWQLVPSVALALLLTGLVAVIADRLVFAKLRERSVAMLVIAGFALGIILRESVRAVWGPSPHFLGTPLQRPIAVAGAFITPIQVWIIGIAIVCMVALHLLLSRTTLGIAMRATSDNARLAEASGIFTERVIRAVWFLGGAYAALGGILLAMDTQLQPNMGFAIIIPVFAAAILGAIGSPYGAMLGALILGFAENIGLAINWAALLNPLGLTTATHLYIPTGYKQAIPFALLIAILLLRPQGLMGSRTR